MPQVKDTTEYQTLYENYSRACVELSRISALNRRLKEENVRLRNIIANMHCAVEHMQDAIMEYVKGGDDCGNWKA